ncbi:unnamed protein product [Linum tenue]|uniref:Uncharacterized protein n=1 Tax=Linum tenue TaxID=586396 RepID=A0AAV0GXV6_9ROSI|nr:unnamed protein product [Linum tenue]CAI0380876.1 unnamed protein product [Linum tenue]
MGLNLDLWPKSGLELGSWLAGWLKKRWKKQVLIVIFM